METIKSNVRFNESVDLENRLSWNPEIQTRDLSLEPYLDYLKHCMEHFRTPEGKEKRMQEVLTLQRLAEVLSISLQTAQGLCRAGEIDAFKIGGGWRIPESALDEFMEKKVREHKKEIGQDSEPETSQILEVYSVMKEMIDSKAEISPEELLKRLEGKRKG